MRRVPGQQQLSEFLKHLNALGIGDPYVVSNSKEVTTLLGLHNSCKFVFSINIEDLFHSVPLAVFLPAVRSCIEGNGDMASQNSAAISVENFLVLLGCYLCSTCFF